MIASTFRLWFCLVSFLLAISFRLQPRCWPLVGRAFVPHCSDLRSALFACLVWVPRVFRWPRLLLSRSSPRLWWACEDFDAAAYRCISIEGGCLRSLASSLWGLCGISLFIYGTFDPVGFW
jgi:hypothetical protein